MGWAASVLVAIGIGWLVRDGQVGAPGGGAALEQAAVPAVDETVAARAGASAPAVVADRPAGTPGSGAEPVTSETVAQGATPGDPGPGGARSDVVAGGAVTTESSATAAGPATARIDGADRAGQPGAADQRTASLPAGPTDRVVSSAPVSPPTISVPSVGALSPVTIVAADEPEPTEVTADRMAVTALMDVSPTARRVRPQPDEHVELPDEAPLIVPGVELVSIENLVEGTAPRGVHIVQRLQGGGTLDVYHLPAGVALSVLPSLPAGHDEVRGRRGDEWVILRGDLERETLRELLARLNSPG
jgi:hypothetical protein